jgi:hypothetical protein
MEQVTLGKSTVTATVSVTESVDYRWLMSVLFQLETNDDNSAISYTMKNIQVWVLKSTDVGKVRRVLTTRTIGETG